MSTHSYTLHADPSASALNKSRSSQNDLAYASLALTIAAAEFVVCVVVLLALISLRVVPAADALSWGAVTLVPLSLSIGFLGVRAGRLGRNLSIIAPRNLPRAA